MRLNTRFINKTCDRDNRKGLVVLVYSTTSRLRSSLSQVDESRA
jgi:hypothetical protein